MRRQPAGMGKRPGPKAGASSSYRVGLGAAVLQIRHPVVQGGVSAVLLANVAV